MRACVRTESTRFNVCSHFTYCSALFVVFVSGVFVWSGEHVALSNVDDFRQHR